MVETLATFGTILIAAAIWQFFNVLGIVVTVETEAGTVANLQALQVQLMTLMLACGLFVSGIVLLATSCIVHRLNPPPSD